MPPVPTNFPPPFTVGGVPTMGMAGLPVTVGNVFFVDYANGSDGYPGTAAFPMKTIYRAYAACTEGKNDVVVVVDNGLSSGSQRLSVANAQAVDSTATTGTLTWAKNATHLIGMAPGTLNSRSRFAPPTGTYTAATFNSGNFVVVSGSGCYFANVSIFVGFSTGGLNSVGWTDSGGRNFYSNCSFGGIADAASAADTGARSLKISGAGEHTFQGCYIGLDTVTRSVANASLEFSGGTARNTFRGCTFPFQTSNAGVLGIIVSAAAGSDRWQQFVDCTFINNIESTSTTMSALATLAASMGGLLLFKNPTMVGITEFGSDATSLAQIYVDGGAPTAASTGIAVNPS